MNRKSKLFFFLSLFCFIIPLINSKEEIEIELDSGNKKIFELSKNTISQSLYVKGTIDESKRYLLISLLDNNLHSSIFITKDQNFAIDTREYDYSFLPRENKFILPSSYFDSKDINGFYLSISWENDESLDYSLQFEYLDEIPLEIGEEISFFARNENVNDFTIKINNKNEKLRLLSTVGNIGFILSGGDEKQLSMKVNNNKANKMINNVFTYWTEDIEEDYSININASKNVKFYFKTQLFYPDENLEENLEENLFNQFFFLKNNKPQSFNLPLSEEDDEKNLIILSQENFIVDFYESEKKYEYKLKNNEKYAISNNLKLSNKNKKICITLNRENSNDISLIQIYLYNKYNKQGTIPEPLIPGISYNYLLSNKSYNIHTHSQFFEKNSEQSNIIGINTLVKSISGKIKVYKDICLTYPKCIYNEASSYKKEIYPLNGYYHTSISSNSDSYFSSNKQNIFIVFCEDEENKCRYEILFSDNQKQKFIGNGEHVSKFLLPYKEVLNSKSQDTYYTYLHSTKNKIVFNLAVYSGDAYMVQINDIKGCRFSEEHFGSDERRIFYCDEDEMDDSLDLSGQVELKIEFGVRAGINGAVYSLHVYPQIKENEEIFIPIENAKFDVIKNFNNKFILFENDKDNKEIVSLINPINCELNLTLDGNRYYSYDKNYIQYKKNIENKTFYDIALDKYNNYNNIDKCLFYLSSYTHSNKDSFLIITENKPLKFKLDKNLDNIRLQYLYGMTNRSKKIFLKVNLVGNSALKIKIVNNNITNEYLVKDTKIIIIMNSNNVNKLLLNDLSKIKIYCQLYSKNSEALVDLKIITNVDTPNFIKRDEQLSDILINNEYKYFIALVNKGSSGNYYINLNNDNFGNIYARLLDSDHIKENGGWNNRFVLPTNNTDKNKILPFDFENQKLIFEKEHTQYCNKYCFLLIGVNLNSNSNENGSNNKIITGFNSYLKLNDNKVDPRNNKNIIKVINNEHISSYVTDDNNEYFTYKLNDYNSNLNLDFECDNCMMTIVFNNSDFNSKNAKTFISNGDKQEIQLGNDTNIRNSTAYIKISTLNNKTDSKDNKNNNKYRYSLKFNAPNDIKTLPNYHYIDDSMPQTCEFNSTKNYYDYVIRLDSYNTDKDINIIAAPNNDKDDTNNNKNIKNDIEIYANILNDNEKITSDSWPNKTKHHFPKNNSKSSNFLTIDKNEIKKEKGEDGKNDKIMLIRVYGNGKTNDKIDLHTNFDNINDNDEKEEKKDLLIPGKYQLVTVNNSNSNSTFKIFMPSNINKSKDYIYKIKKLDGKGKVIYGDDTYEINDKYDSASFPLEQNKNKIEIKSDNLNNNINNKYNESFTFLIKYEEKNKLNSLENIKIGGSKFFSSKDDTEAIDYFIPLENINSDLPININFDTLNSREEDEYKNQIRNNTETFDINAFLINEDELNQIKNGNISFLNKKKDLESKYNGNYYLENKHGFLNINKDDIDKYKKNNKGKKTYVYFSMKKSKINDKNYDKIKGNINIYPSNNTQNPLPENDYHYNSIDCTKNNLHIYKLGDILKNTNENISSSTHNMTIDFISPIEGLKVKIVKGPNVTEEDEKYFGINKINNNNGKDTIIVSENIDKAYLLVETPDKLLNKTNDYNTNVDYMFKYSYVDKKKDNDKKHDVKYNNTLSYNKMGKTDLKTNITLYKIKDSKTNKNIPCNYYIRILKNSKIYNSDNKDNFYPKKEISLINNYNENEIYAIYKIDSSNSLLQNETEDSFTVPIEIDTDEPVIVDVLAEDVETKQIYGYSKGYPNSNNDGDQNGNDKDVNNENKNNGIGLIKIILISVCLLLLVILLIVCCIKTCSCSSSKKPEIIDEPQMLNIGRGLSDISFLTQNSKYK